MKKVILGVLIGILALTLFVWFNGSRYVKVFGTKTIDAGEKIEKIEKEMREKAKGAEKSVKKTLDRTVDATKEKVKKIMP
ncbi:MAG: hypothetical protein HZB83_02370 [Deltaproteobacteria bacterium]|nr:hypothetical protein [Deltaproteobacteria bacterium]